MTIAGRWEQAPRAQALLRSARPGWAELVLVPGLVCGATGIVRLGSKSLWLDESVSATLAQLGWRDLAGVLVARETNMALYHLVLKAWTEIFGAGELAVRGLSVLCAAGAACAVTVLAGRLLGRRAAVVAGLLFGLNPVVLVFAQTARGYALCLLLVVAAELLLVEAVRRRSRSAWIGHAGVTACAVFTNSLVVLLPVANLLALATLPRSMVRRRDVAGSTVLLLVLVIPFVLRVQRANAAGVGWIASSGGGRLVERLNDVILAAVSLSLLAVAVAGTLAVVVRAGRSATPRSSRFAPALLASWLVVPIVGVLALSIGYRPLLVPRYLVFCLPPLLILVAAALARPRPAAATAAGVALALLLSLALDVMWYRAAPKEDWRSAVAEVAARGGAGDGILFYPAYSSLPFDYYRSRVPGAVQMAHAGPEQARGVAGLGPVAIGPSVAAASARQVSRLWLVVRRGQAGPSAGERAVRRGIEDAGLVAASQRCFERACVAEYRRPAP